MNRQDQGIYRLDGVEIDTSRVCVKRDGEERHLRQKTFQVLIYLLEQRDRLVTKDELIEHAWQGTAVTDNALEQCLAEIRKVLGDDSRNPRFIKTVPRAGYRFIGKVEEVSATAQATATSQNGNETTTPAAESLQTKVGLRKRVLLIALAVILIVGVTTIYLSRQRRSLQSLSTFTLPQTAGKQSVAIMFFDNQSDSADLDWLREGLADMLITDLSRSRNLTILSRQQLHTLLDRIGHQSSEKIRLEEALDIAQKSKAQIVILGTFARLGDQIRIDAQLHDARDGQMLAAERLVVDQPAQILTQVDLLSMKLASHLGSAEQPGSAGLTSAMTSNLAAYRYYSLGVEKAQAIQNPEAIALLQRAIALDPDFAMAYARIGYTYVVSWGLHEKGKPYLEKAFKLTARLSEKDKLNIAAWYALANQDYAEAIKSFQLVLARYPLEVEAYRGLARLLRGENRHDEAIEILKQGLVIDSDAKDLYNTLGSVYSDLGRHDEAIAMFQRYVKLAPDEPNAHDSLAMGYQWAGRYQEAIEEYERALKLKPDFDLSVIHLANTLYQTGRYAESLQEFQHYIEIAPTIGERARGYSGISVIKRSRGRMQEAERAARQALACDNTSVGQLFVTALAKGDLTAAEKLKQTLEKVPLRDRGTRGNLRELAYFQGLFELNNKQGPEAIERFKEALVQRAPLWNFDAYEDCLANAYLSLSRFDEAITEYNRILRLNPDYPLAHYHLAQIYERRQQTDRARAEYEHFLQVWKSADVDLEEVVAAKKAILSNN